MHLSPAKIASLIDHVKIMKKFQIIFKKMTFFLIFFLGKKEKKNYKKIRKLGMD